LNHLQLYPSKAIVPAFVEVRCMKLEQKDFDSLRLVKEQKEESLNTPIEQVTIIEEHSESQY
jgi:hypothetical protein